MGWTGDKTMPFAFDAASGIESSIEFSRTQARHDMSAKMIGMKDGEPVFVYGKEAADIRKNEREQTK